MSALSKVKRLRPTEKVDTVAVARKARHLVPNKLQRAVTKQALVVSRNSPTLLLGAGIALGVGGAVLACRSTLKAGLLVEEHRLRRASIAEEVGINIEYGDKEERRDITVLYIQTALKFTKLYAPAIGLGVLSVCALTGSHKILGNRYAAASAAYTTTMEAFNQYRERVVEDAGEQKDREYRYGKKTETTTVDTPNGPKKVKVTRADLPGNKSQYARLWDENTSSEYRHHGDSNKGFLKIQQCWANDALKARGVYFLNDAYKLLGLDPTPEGQFVGWVYGEGDGFIDFGLHEGDIQTQQFFEDGKGGIWLDFNVQGPVHEKLRELSRRG